jgi:transposase
MESLLVQPMEWAEVERLQRDMERLQGEVLELRGEMKRLRSENLELRQQAGYWKNRFQHLQEKVHRLEAENELLRAEKSKLQDQLFGRKSEKQSKDRRSNVLDDPDEAAASPKRSRGQQAGRKGPPRRDYAHLPAREEIVELPEAEQVCPRCGQSRVRLGASEDSEQIEIEITIVRRVIRRQRYRATCTCSDHTFTASAPPKLIPKGRLGSSVWLEILLEKFAYQRPMARLLAAWRERGLDLAAGTVTDGLQRLTPLFEPIYQALLERNRQSRYAQADETRWLVFIDHEGKVGHLWWLWVFIGQDTVVYRLDPGRSHEVPEGHYSADARLVLMVDRYSAYKAMAQVKNGSIVFAFCWAHQRRDFIRVGKAWPELKRWALEWLKDIRELYRLNDQRLQAPDSGQRTQADAADAFLRASVARFKAQSEQQLADPQLRAPCRKVLESLTEHWHGLTRFVDDPRIPMDNNRSERQVRGPALGRKNFYGSAALWSGRLATMLFSIFATLRHLGLSPRRWLEKYLQACAANKGHAPTDIHSFLPWHLSTEQRQQLMENQPDSS